METDFKKFVGTLCASHNLNVLSQYGRIQDKLFQTTVGMWSARFCTI